MSNFSKQEGEKRMKQVLLADPRGFCAGVDRAIDIVRLALEAYPDQPVYVRHEIVHNRHVVKRLERKGAIFVETLDEVPDDAVVIFSAHGIPQSVRERAEERGLTHIDATCPLVTKVHLEAQKYYHQGRNVILIGHEGHPEVEGTMGQVPENIYLISSADEIDDLPIDPDEPAAYLTQTTLSVDDTASVVQELENVFDDIVGPSQEDICYATQNRQDAVKSMAEQVDFILVIGAPNSSNSNRLVEVSRDQGVPAELVQEDSEIDPDWLEEVDVVGLTAGASAPEDLVKDVIEWIGETFNGVETERLTVAEEDLEFNLPEPLQNV